MTYFQIKNIIINYQIKAFIYEVIRIGTILNITAMRQINESSKSKSKGSKKGINICTKDRNYFLANNTLIALNSRYIDFNKSSYQYPDTIYLKHHLIYDNRLKHYVFKMNKYFHSFGSGPRVCPVKMQAIEDMIGLIARLLLNDYIFEININDTSKQCKDAQNLLKLPINQRKINFRPNKTIFSSVIVKKRR